MLNLMKITINNQIKIMIKQVFDTIIEQNRLQYLQELEAHNEYRLLKSILLRGV